MLIYPDERFEDTYTILHNRKIYRFFAVYETETKKALVTQGREDVYWVEKEKLLNH